MYWNLLQESEVKILTKNLKKFQQEKKTSREKRKINFKKSIPKDESLTYNIGRGPPRIILKRGGRMVLGSHI